MGGDWVDIKLKYLMYMYVLLLLENNVTKVPRAPASEENRGRNEVSNTTRPWSHQQNHDKHGEKTANKMENDGEQTKK